MIPAFMNLGTGEIIIIFLIILLLFGAARIPALMRSLGKGVKSFKEGMNEVTNEINSSSADNQNNDKGEKAN